MFNISIYTDGSCINNPGPGGCAALVKYKEKEFIFKAGYYYTTNNRMELMAFILPMKFILYKFYQILNIYLFTDSLYLYNGINIWMFKWKDNYWRNSKNKFIKNIDLWFKIYKIILFLKRSIKIFYIRSHDNNLYNKKCDEIAFKQAKNPFLNDLNPNIYKKI